VVRKILDCLFDVNLTCVDAGVANLGMPKSVFLSTHCCTLCANSSSDVHFRIDEVGQMNVSEMKNLLTHTEGGVKLYIMYLLHL